MPYFFSNASVSGRESTSCIDVYSVTAPSLRARSTHAASGGGAAIAIEAAKAASAAAIRTSGPLLEQLEERAEDLAVGRDDAAAREEAVVALEVADEPPGLAHEERSGRHVPRQQPDLPEPVDASARDPREIERRGTPPAEARGDLKSTRLNSSHQI